MTLCLGVFLAIVGQHPCEARRGAPHGRAHLELAARRVVGLADGGFGRIEQVEGAAALLVPGGAGLGQAQVTAGAMQQPRPERLLELCHVLAGHRRRQAQPLGRGHETAGLDDFAEHTQAGHPVHGNLSCGELIRCIVACRFPCRKCLQSMQSLQGAST
jgi:hypothetical protein